MDVPTHRHPIPVTAAAAVVEPPEVVRHTTRHAGRVYVRGRIRRIWRPRYLELLDDGTLRYSEGHHPGVGGSVGGGGGGGGGVTVTVLRSQQEQDHPDSAAAAAAESYKYTLLVTGARILDVTTIRDLHTGLPRGTFGFVVRGQRMAASVGSGGVRNGSGVGDSVDSDIGGTPAPPPPTSISNTSTNQDVMTDSFVLAEDDDHDTVTRNTTTPTTTNTPTVPIRDYLCAVPTLEEAQMWVVALQWAASIGPTPHQHQDRPPADHPINTTNTIATNTIATTTVPTVPIPTVVDHHWWKVDYHTSHTTSTGGGGGGGDTTSNIPKATPNTILVTEKDDGKVTAVGESTPQNVRLPPPTLVPDGDNRPAEKILVTAVTGYSVVRHTTWTLEIVYHIHAMLLFTHNNHDHQDDTTTTSSRDSGRPVVQQQQRCVEQWSLQRTAAQFQSVATELFRHVGTDTTTSSSNTDWNVLRRLPTWSSRPTIAEVDQSLSIADSVLRSWILSPHLVNTEVLKEFLGLGNMDLHMNHKNGSQEKIGTSLFQSLFRHVHCTNPLAIHQKSTTIVPNHVSSDVYVREWLQSVRRTGIQPRSNTSIINNNNNITTIGLLSLLFKTKPTTSTDVSQIAIQLHHHHYHERNMLYFGGAAVAVIGIIPTVLPLWKYIMPVITIRFDYLLASWVGATYLGHRIRLSSTHSYPSASTRTDRGGISSNQRHGVPMSSRHKTFGTSTAAPSSSTSLKSIGTYTVVDQSQAPDSPKAASSSDNSVVMVTDYVDAVHSSDMDDFADFVPTTTTANEPYYQHPHQQHLIEEGHDDDDESDGEATTLVSDDLLQRPTGSDNYLSSLSNDNNGMINSDYLSSPLPKYPNNNGSSCWSQPSHDIFHVRGATYLRDKIKVCSGPSPLTCRGVDVWITDNPERHIARHPSILGGRLNDVDTFLVNFLLPFGNLVAYFEIPPLSSFPQKLRTVWTKFLKGDQQYRDARLKLLPVVVDGPWIVKTAVGPGKSPALLGKAIPLQYFFRDPDGKNRKGIYEVDVIITASTIAKGILSVVKSQTKTVSIAFAFIIEAVDQSELPETVLCSFQVHSLHLEECPSLPPCNFD